MSSLSLLFYHSNEPLYDPTGLRALNSVQRFFFIFRNQQEVLKNGIAGILGNKPNLTIEIVQIKSLSDSQTEVKVTVSERGVTGSSRKIPASDLALFFNQPGQKQQLTNVGVISITPFVTPTKAELEEYLKHPPPGKFFI